MSRKLVEIWFDAFCEKDISKFELAEDFVHTGPFGEIKGGQVYFDMIKDAPILYDTKRNCE